MLCLVTSRHRLAGAGASLEHARDCLIRQAQFAVDAGIDLVQVREHDLEAADVASAVRAILDVTRGTATRVVVNDRLDVALTCGADGVHLRGDSLPVDAARRIAPPGFLVGRSVHSIDEAVRASDADYLIAGTVFPTASKPDLAGVLGIGGFRAIVNRVRTPVLAIGGVRDDANIEALARSGASGFAAIGLFVGARSGAELCSAIPLVDVVQRVRKRFDSIQVAS